MNENELQLFHLMLMDVLIVLMHKCREEVCAGKRVSLPSHLISPLIHPSLPFLFVDH